jgi:AcrR family transcriptional regulator
VTSTIPRASRQARRRILDAALDSFAERGYEATTIDDIRTASGASIGTIYHHFKSKQGIAATLFLEGLGSYQEGVIAVYAANADAEAGVRAVVRHYLAWAAANPRLARFLLTTRQPEVRAETDAQLHALNARFYGATEDWWRRQTEAGVVRALPREIVTTIVVGPAEAFMRRWLAGRTSTSLEDATRALEDTAWRAVRAP